MVRLNLTLDSDTLSRLERHAKRTVARRTHLARDLVREGLARREAAERRQKLAADYAAGRADARAALEELSASQVELVDDDEV